MSILPFQNIPSPAWTQYLCPVCARDQITQYHNAEGSSMKNILCARFEVLTLALLEIQVWWFVTRWCGVDSYRMYREIVVPSSAGSGSPRKWHTESFSLLCVHISWAFVLSMWLRKFQNLTFMNRALGFARKYFSSKQWIIIVLVNLQ